MRVHHTSTPIFVLNLRPDPLHHGALPIARSAGRLGVPVYVTHAGRSAPAALSRYVRGCLVVPREASIEEWLDNLLRIGRRLGRTVLVIGSVVEGTSSSTITMLALVGLNNTPPAVDMTRPLCVFPKVAKYTGSGSTNLAANFVCVTDERDFNQTPAPKFGP